MGAQSDSKKVSISSANPVVISNVPPVSEPSALLYLSVVISLLGAIGIGLVIGYFSPVISGITQDLTARSWMSGAMPLAALFGGLCAPLFIMFLGKKKSLIVFGLPFTVGWACFALDNLEGFTPTNHMLFYFGRVVTGFACGLVCGVAPGRSEVSSFDSAEPQGQSNFLPFPFLPFLQVMLAKFQRPANEAHSARASSFSSRSAFCSAASLAI